MRPVVDASNFTTRYLGSKRRLANWIVHETRHLRFDSVLDAFGGTASVSYAFKRTNKQVIYNDLLSSNYHTGLALVENSSHTLSEEEVSWITTKHKEIDYPTFIAHTFSEIYYKDRENEWLDMAVTNIFRIRNPYKRSLALHALFQCCMMKRPFNLFHRRNLYIRLANVKRKFNNKVTWEKPFKTLFEHFAKEASACVFDNGHENLALNYDALKIPKAKTYDLVYIDPPYISENGKTVNYFTFYHFLEGLCSYRKWPKMIDYESINRCLVARNNSWGSDVEKVDGLFDKLFRRFQDSILLVSYRSPGIPSEHTLRILLEQFKRKVTVKRRAHKYALSKPGRKCFEVLFVAS
jgi:adenine-specific DNA methylase